MVPDAGLPVAHASGKEGPAVGTEGIVEPEGFRHIRQAVPGDGPVGNLIVNGLGPHVVYVLGVVGAPLRLAGADELIGLKDDVSDAALAYPGVLAAPGVDPVHHHARHGLHAVLPLAARLALDQARQQLPVGICHGAFLLCRWFSIRKKEAAGDSGPSGPGGLLPEDFFHGSAFCQFVD